MDSFAEACCDQRAAARTEELEYRTIRLHESGHILHHSDNALAGLAGSLKTLVMGFATLSDVHWSMSGEVILMTLLGGVGTFFGPVLGSGIVISLQNLLADKVGSWVTVIIGVIFVVCVLAFRKGVVGELQAFRERRRNAALAQNK